ncbi:MAG: hypothetical protein J6K75_03915, partial [Erysipelotrichaceae bacterium]|nr:hypothetical protein [Erysipelotrichaceae bacterium]
KVLNKTTQLIQSGIKYGDLSQADKLKVDLLTEDRFDDSDIIPGSKLFKSIYNEDTCRKVIEDLMDKGLKVDQGQKLGKTIIFAYNHNHAELIVDTFNKMYPEYLDYCQLIDNQVKNSEHLIEKFENEDHFRIAVSVDMLDTGIDVPSVLNLVFFKQVKSKIKFVQMIGRGTRLCEGLIDGKDKTHFQIFDYCGNFEYFDQHPDGTDGLVMQSITQKLFNLRLDLMEELQRYEHQIIIEEKKYYDEIKFDLHTQIKALKKSNRLSVRANMNYVDKYSDISNLTAISKLGVKEIKAFLSPLIVSELKEDSKVLSFDFKMLKIEYGYLTTGKIDSVLKIVQQVRDIAKILLIDYAAIQQVMDKSNELIELMSKEYWDSIDLGKLEKSRKAVRELLQFIDNGQHHAVLIDTPDVVIGGNPVNTGLVDIRTYQEKILDYLMENSTNPTILKIKNLEPINEADIKELENILWLQTGTKEDYYKFTKIDNLAVFIRSIAGIEQSAVNEKFKDYLNDNFLTSEQMEFIYSIINYVRENGDINVETIIEESPFNNHSIFDLFGEKAMVVTNVVNTIHNCIVV